LRCEIDARCADSTIRVSNADVLNRHTSAVLKERRIAVMFREPATAVRRAKWSSHAMRPTPIEFSVAT
jgi:hypothetical protein